MQGMSVSLGVVEAIAAMEAAHGQHKFIEPVHLLIGVCKFSNLVELGDWRGLEISDNLAAALKAEAGAIVSLYAQFQIDPVALYREARQREGMTSSRHQEYKLLIRSPESRTVFARAAELAAGAPAVTPFHLLAALLDEAEGLAALLKEKGVDTSALRAAALALSPLFPGMRDPAIELQKHVLSPFEQCESGPIRPAVVTAKHFEKITQSLDADKPAFDSVKEAATDADRRLAFFYELPLKFGQETQLDALLQLVLERVVNVIPDATRGALLVKDRQTGQLLRSASMPVDSPAVSTTLAHQAITRREAFIWSKDVRFAEAGEEAAEALPGSVREHNIESAMYAPLLWKDKVFGVLCVDNHETPSGFRGDDLRLLQAVAHHAAIAIANLQLQEDLRHETKVLSNFLKLTSPQLAERLQQYTGPIRLGGEFRDATILFSDMRGFTKLSAQMEPEDVTDMLEDYFSRLVPIIFEHQGIIDKFVGDAIVAVFGSPQADKEQHRHAIQAALEMQTAMQEVNAKRIAQGKHGGELGIGIHFGGVVHGFIGSPERMEFTVIGDAVNYASRYCDGAVEGEVLISPEMYQWIWDIVEVEQTSVMTKHEGELPAFRIKRIKKPKE
jgi:adenylate cyclase